MAAPMRRKMSCYNLFKLTTFKVVIFAVFILINVLLYTQSKYVIMDTFFYQFGSHRSSTAPQNLTSKHSHTNFLFLTTSPNNSIDAVHRDYSTRGLPFLEEPIVNPHDFVYTIRPNMTCLNREIELVIAVVISQDNHLGRTVIRKTWGSYIHEPKNNAILVFFIGSKGNISEKSEGNVQSKIQEEAFIFGDILQEDYIDSYENLSLKSVSVLKWVSSFCPNTNFILKVDDDMYVNIPFLVTVLRDTISNKQSPGAFVMGSMQVEARPIRNRDSKWYTPISMFSENVYPNYVSGTAYVMTSEAASLLYEASLRVPKFWLEDIYITGICSRKAGVKVYNSGYFSYGKPKASGCSFKAHVSGHRYSQEEILTIHKELYDPGLSC